VSACAEHAMRGCTHPYSPPVVQATATGAAGGDGRLVASRPKSRRWLHADARWRQTRIEGRPRMEGEDGNNLVG
jgi:hypothetical protein